MADRVISVPPWEYGSREDVRKWLGFDPGPFEALAKAGVIPPADLQISRQTHYWRWDTIGALAVLLPFLLLSKGKIEE